MAEVTYTPGLVTSFASGAVTLNTTTYTQVGFVTVANLNGRVGLRLTVAGQALTSLKITRSLVPGGHEAGTQKDLAVDADLDTATEEIQNCLPATAYTAAAGTVIEIVCNTDGVAEIGVYAKSNAGTLALSGFLPKD
jgi:hypothetical protein